MKTADEVEVYIISLCSEGKGSLIRYSRNYFNVQLITESKKSQKMIKKNFCCVAIILNIVVTRELLKMPK